MSTALKKYDPIATEISRLVDEHGGRVSPQIVLDSARSPDSPLHSHFEWDDTKASEAFRQFQAAGLIRRVKITVTTVQRDPVRVELNVERAETVRALISDPALRGSGASSYLRRQEVPPEVLLREAVRALEATRSRFADVPGLEPVWDALDEVAAT